MSAGELNFVFGRRRVPSSTLRREKILEHEDHKGAHEVHDETMSA